MERGTGGVSLFSPAFFCGVLSDLLTLGWRQRISSGSTALQSALAAKRHGGRVFVRVGRGRDSAILDLAGEDIADQLSELDGIARAGKAFDCHAPIMPWK